MASLRLVILGVVVQIHGMAVLECTGVDRQGTVRSILGAAVKAQLGSLRPGRAVVVRYSLASTGSAVKV
jgi:hypothetical protein